jgi:hypothetical protein
LIFIGDLKDPLTILSLFFIFCFGMILLLMQKKSHNWRKVSFFIPVVSIFFGLMIPEDTPFWGIYLPIIGTMVFMISSHLGGRMFKKIDHLIPMTGGVMAFLVVYMDDGSLLLSLIAAGLVGSLSTVMRELEKISILWEKKVGERISILLLLMVIGYLAFYVYYAWTEVYLTEFILQATLMGGLLFWVIRSKHVSVKTTRSSEGRIKRLIRTVRIRRRLSLLFMMMIIFTIPISVEAFLEDNWFQEENMDKRPYMRTIKEISTWIEDNSDEDDMVLAWHCYALEADRETILSVSNAAVYNGGDVIREMESNNVSLFVRCWYTDHGVWNRQPVFQNYILSNFYIDKMVDGNECWKKME